jgi:hypothetical protein
MGQAAVYMPMNSRTQTPILLAILCWRSRCCQQGAPVESRPGTKNLLGQRWMLRSPSPPAESPVPSMPLRAPPTSSYSFCWACLHAEVLCRAHAARCRDNGTTQQQR